MATSGDLEARRLRKIQENKEKLQALGVKDAAREALVPAENTKQSKQPAKRKKLAPATPASLEKRASERTKHVVINYNEDQNDHLLRGLPRRGSANGSRSAYSGPRELDDDDAYHARVEAGVVLQSQSLDGTSGRKRGPQDSGKGVRVMGGKVYDSKYGVTCHWCRQKTLCETVTCTSASCGVRRMPYSFCKSCLMNRHGEDWKQARESGCWVCPPCRGSCGAGCTLCCNCGPCRKKAGLAPTGQVKSQAIADGFDNVHDWLVFRETGESAAALVLRKWDAPWASCLARKGDKFSDGEKEENPNTTNCADDKKLQAHSNSCSGEAMAKTQQEECPDLYGTAADEPPRKFSRPHQQAGKATKQTAGKRNMDTAPGSPDGVALAAEVVPLPGDGILAVSPSVDEGEPDLRTALEPRRLDFNDSAENEAEYDMLPLGTAPVASSQAKEAGDVYQNLTKVPKRSVRYRRGRGVH